MAEPARRVLLSGYYGFGNVGDDALYIALTGLLRECGATAIAVPAGPLPLPPAEGVIRLGRFDLTGMARFLRRGAVVVSGGGGLFQDATSGRSLAYYLGILALARRLHRPYAVCAQSLGPLGGKLGRRLVRRMLDGAAAVTVRDARSRDAAAELGVSRAPRVTLDPVFALPPPTTEELAAAEDRLPPRPRVALCLRPTQHTETVLAAVAEWLPAAGGAPCLLACQAADHELAGRLTGAACALPPGGVRETLAAVAACDLVVAERLHALIFALLAGVPAVAVDYDPKVAGLAADAGVPVAGRDADLTAPGLAAAVATTTPTRRRELVVGAAARVKADFRTLFEALVQADSQ
ncbi:MAG: polysaccharide pyruvyl transferase CsaB [Armatimonadetes bacterium]|nr:polysaccharide pyruvyl transferase CsaB [Armatimonadota bacterium]